MKRPTPAVNIRLSQTTIYCICTNCQAPFCVCQPTYLWIVLFCHLSGHCLKNIFWSSLKIFPLSLDYYATLLRRWEREHGHHYKRVSPRLESSGWLPVVHCTHCTPPPLHCTPGKVHSVCAQILQFCNVTVFIWFCVGTCSHTIKYVSSSNFFELRVDSPSNYVTYQLCFTPSKKEICIGASTI